MARGWHGDRAGHRAAALKRRRSAALNRGIKKLSSRFDKLHQKMTTAPGHSIFKPERKIFKKAKKVDRAIQILKGKLWNRKT
jgi:hypothetical protein